jgi:hypothetical protein
MQTIIKALFIFVISLISVLNAHAEGDNEYPFSMRIDTMPMQSDFRQSRKIIAMNRGPVPVSVSLNINNPLNVRFQPIISGAGHAIVVPARTDMVLTTATNLKADKPSTFSYTYKFFFGEPGATQKRSVTYKVPFESAIPLSAKSYNGIYASNKAFAMDLVNAIQFYIPRTTDILAARRGMVLDVKGLTDHSDDGKTSNLGNYVLMMHEDGIMSYYANLTPHSVTVKPLQIVEAGQKIGTSGHEYNNQLNYFIFSVLKNAGGHKSKSMQFVLETDNEQIESNKLTGFISETQSEDPYIQKFEGGYNSGKKGKTTIQELQTSVQTAKNKIIETNNQLSPESDTTITHRVSSYVFYFVTAIAFIFLVGTALKLLAPKKNTSEKTKLSFSLVSKYEPQAVFLEQDHYKLFKRLEGLLPTTTGATINSAFSSFLAPTTFKINVFNNPISTLYADIFLYQNTTLTPLAVIDVQRSFISKLTSLLGSRKQSILKQAGLPYVQLSVDATEEQIADVIRDIHFKTLTKEKRSRSKK